MSNRTFVVTVLAAVLLAGVCGVVLAASVPTQLTIQGVLLASGGNPPPAGNKTFTFRIFDLSSGGTQVWPTPAPMGEEQIVSTDQGGRWTAQVGAVVPLSASVFDGAERWLDITVNDGINPPEAVTRIPIKASPYAYRVATVQGADAGDIQGVMGIRDPGGDDSLLIGPGGMTFHTSGEPVTGPRGITFEAAGSMGSGHDADSIWMDSGDAERAKIAADGFVFTGPTDTGFVAWWPGEEWQVGINTGHPTEALTVGGAVRAMASDDADMDPWIGARKSLVIAKEGADEWGRSIDGDSAGIYFPADDDDFAIMSSKALVDKTEMRISVGDDLDDHILLMPSGNVGISTTNPIEKLDVAGNVRANKIALGGALIDATRALTAVEDVATSDWGIGVRNTGGGARLSISAVPTNLAAITLLSNGSDRWFLGKGIGPENFFISSNVAGTVLTIDRTTGYFGLGTGAPAHPVELASGAHCTVGGTWTNASDSALKTNFNAIDGNELLSRIAQLRIQQWNYRAEDASIRHIGPMAQDFYAAFGVGEDDKHITTIDADGVALAAIQALNQELNEQKSENEELRMRIAELRVLVEQLMAEEQ